MGIQILTERRNTILTKTWEFWHENLKVWIRPPSPIRKFGGSLFADFRYDTIFIYHNGARIPITFCRKEDFEGQ